MVLTKLQSKAREVKIGSYFTLPRRDKNAIYEVREDNKQSSKRAHYIGSLEKIADAKKIISKLNSGKMSRENLDVYFKQRKEQESEEFMRSFSFAQRLFNMPMQPYPEGEGEYIP